MGRPQPDDQDPSLPGTGLMTAQQAHLVGAASCPSGLALLLGEHTPIIQAGQLA